MSPTEHPFAVILASEKASRHSGGLDVHTRPEIETALFRVCQEAINRLARHSQAETVGIELCTGNDRLDDRAHYSLPCEYGRRRVEIRAFHDRMEFCDGAKLFQWRERS